MTTTVNWDSSDKRQTNLYRNAIQNKKNGPAYLVHDEPPVFSMESIPGSGDKVAEQEVIDEVTNKVLRKHTDLHKQQLQLTEREWLEPVDTFMEVLGSQQDGGLVLEEYRLRREKSDRLIDIVPLRALARIVRIVSVHLQLEVVL